MSRSSCFVAACLGVVAVAALSVGNLASAQPAAQLKSSLDATGPKRPRLRDGFVVRLDAASNGKELERQENLWVMEVTFKSMRMRYVEITDPKTKQKKRELIWYLIYKAVNRPVVHREDTGKIIPKNVEDVVPPSLFVPEFLLVTSDNGAIKRYHDVLIPEAQADILKFREKRYPRQPYLKNTVEMIGPIPAVSKVGAKDEHALYGIVTWRGIDPNTDFFKVYMSGFSNAYLNRKAAIKLSVPELVGVYLGIGGNRDEAANLSKAQLLDLLFPNVGGKGIVYRKTILQKYYRPGDRFLQSEAEISRVDDPKWFYWPDDAKENSPTVKPPPSLPAVKPPPSLPTPKKKAAPPLPTAIKGVTILLKRGTEAGLADAVQKR